MNPASKKPVFIAAIVVIADLIIKAIIFRAYEFGQWTELFGGRLLSAGYIMLEWLMDSGAVLR